MTKMNKLSICNAVKKAKQQFSGIEIEDKASNPFLIDTDVFPSETFKCANSSFFDPKIIGEFQAKQVIDWSKKDFLNLVKHLYFQKFVSDIQVPPAYGYMYLNVIEEICTKNFPESNVKILKAKYIDWYFENHILRDTIKYNSRWNIKKMVAPRVVASFIMHFSGRTDALDVMSKKTTRLPVNESLLELYYRGDASEFIRCYGVIIPFTFLFYSKKLSWDDCFEYTAAGICDLVQGKNFTEKMLKKITEQYSPYNERFNKIEPDRLLVALTERTSLNLRGVKLT